MTTTAKVMEKKCPEDAVFPITREEHDMLMERGWESGFGWETQLDYYITPSAGPIIFVDEEPSYYQRFMDDLNGIRREIAHQALREKIGTEAQNVVGLLEELHDWFADRADADLPHGATNYIPNDEMRWQTEISDLLERVTAPPARTTDAKAAALAKARGEAS